MWNLAENKILFWSTTFGFNNFESKDTSGESAMLIPLFMNEEKWMKQKNHRRWSEAVSVSMFSHLCSIWKTGKIKLVIKA